MSLTSIVGKVFLPRQMNLQRHQTDAELLQATVLRHLLDKAAETEYGRNHLFNNTRSYDDFARNVPINTYEDLKGDIDRMRHGESNVLWPGQIRWYAKSSGTTNDKSKFIPVSHDGLHNIHYAGGFDTVALYLRNNPKSRMFDGKGLILGGSHSPNYNLPGSLVGDLSAILIENINPLANLVRVTSMITPPFNIWASSLFNPYLSVLIFQSPYYLSFFRMYSFTFRLLSSIINSGLI